ncbi:hypothetical protein B484DRAFT_213655 [Ochromonadaceae sp. CCMP2298]|nr:hypothetical protein B484DRAFT_213655 [Ochromonadaceae sp. CCMP2298]
MPYAPMLYALYSTSCTPLPFPFVQVLINAVGRGDVRAVRTLLSGSAESVAGLVNAKNEQGKTAVHLACAWGHLELLRLLLEKGADIGVKDKVSAVRATYVGYDGGY